MGVYELHHGDCLDVLRGMADNSVDSIVTDPPYGLSFMGKKWDYDVPSVDVWRECLRVLKPGGHLLAFAGTRTQHRMAVRIEDAGFEIRDMIAWVYSTGFPKSLDASKAIDKMHGAERADAMAGGHRGIASDDVQTDEYKAVKDAIGHGVGCGAVSRGTPVTDAARQWQGWGTALKPALETVTFASKPYTDEQERDIMQSNLIRLEARLWLLSFASAAEKNSTSNPSEYGAACAIAQWSADEITNTRAALCGQMDTSRFESATTTSLSIVSSWRRTLAASWNDGSTSIIETKSSTTIDWRTLKFSLSQITPASIIKACSLPGGFSVNATTAENHFNASLSLLQNILTLSATEPAISQEAESYLVAGVTPNLDPCIMARKPLVGTVAENVLAHGTGALNIDGCRVEPTGESRDRIGEPSQNRRYTEAGGTNFAATPGVRGGDPAGRWPANLIHDGHPDVLALFPCEADGVAPVRGVPVAAAHGFTAADLGSAARFFYCAKPDREDRDAGLHGREQAKTGDGRKVDCDNAFQRGATLRSNTHPTVKPTDLMRYLCRLVTPPGGTVLDPFNGSGSTGKGAVLEGFRYIGMDREAEYLEISRARIEHALLLAKAGTDVLKPAAARDAHTLDLFGAAG